MANPPKSVETDPYYTKVRPKSDEDLIVRSNTDLSANMEATRTNLIKEASRLSGLIDEQSSSKAVTEECSKLLEEARKKISAEIVDWSEVLTKFDAIKCRLLRAYESKKVWPTWFLIILVFNIICLSGIGYFIWSKSLIPGQTSLQQGILVVFACTLWGALGGTVDALFALHTHISDRDFDMKFLAWYFLHPLLGLALGGVVFLLFYAGLMATADTQLKEMAQTVNATANVTNNVTNGGTSGVPAGGTILPIALAFLAGFKQKAAYDFISRVVKSAFTKNDEQETKG